MPAPSALAVIDPNTVNSRPWPYAERQSPIAERPQSSTVSAGGHHSPISGRSREIHSCRSQVATCKLCNEQVQTKNIRCPTRHRSWTLTKKNAAKSAANFNNGAPFRIKLRTHIPLKYRYNFPRCIVRRRYRFRRHGQSAIDGFCDERLPTIHLAKVGLPSKRTEPSPTSRQCCYKPPLRPAQISHSCSLQPSESRFIRRIFLNGQSNEPSVRSDVHGYILSE